MNRIASFLVVSVGFLLVSSGFAQGKEVENELGKLHRLKFTLSESSSPVAQAYVEEARELLQEN